MLGLVAWALAGRGLVNYDTLYALVWGRDLTHGTLPDYDVSLAPTPHPLATLAGAILSVLGAQGAIDATIVLAFVFLGALGWVTYRLGERMDQPRGRRRWPRRSSSPAARCSTSALAPTSTSPTSRSCSAPCSSRRGKPRAGAPVLALLGLAGLIRPEAWLFSGAYLDLAVGRRRARPAAVGAGRRRAAAVGARRPHRHRRPAALAHRHARHGAAPAARHRPGRRPGHRAAAPGRDPARARPLRRRRRRAAGARLPAPRASRSAPRPASSRSSPSACSPPPACRSSGATCSRPPTILAIFCGAGAFGWAELPRGHPWRRRWAWFGALTLVGLVAFIPPQVDRIGNLRDALRIQDAIQDDLHALTPRFPCTPVTVPNHRPVPLLALWLDVDPQRIAVAQERAAAQRHLRRADAASGSRAGTSSTRATSIRASRRRRPASGPSGRTRRGAPSRAADKRTVHPPSKQVYERLRLERLRHRVLPLRTPGSA